MNSSARAVSCGLLSGVGGLLVAFEFRHTLMMQTFVGRIVEAVIPLILALGLVYAGYWLYTSDFDTEGVVRVTTWVGAGMIVLILTTVWVISHQLIRGLVFDHAMFVVINSTTVGGLAGFVTGVYDVRGRKLAYEQATLETEHRKLQFLNSVLRHNVLNSMNVLLGKTRLLYRHLPEAQHEALESIENRGENVVTHIENVWQYTRIVTTGNVEGDLTAVNLSRVLTEELANARTTYDEAELTGDVPDGVYVLADDLLEPLVETLLANALQRDVQSPTSVEVTLKTNQVTAELSVRDDSSRQLATRIEELSFDESGRSPNEATEVGLALANVLVQRYDGDIQIESAEPNGTVVTVTLPLVRERNTDETDSTGNGDRG